jgi:hypothetical protein
MLSAEAKPLLLVPAKLVGRELTTLRVLRIVVVDLGMAFETQGDGVLDFTAGQRSGRLDMVNFDLHSTEAVADAAAPMAADKEGLDVFGTKLVPALTGRPRCHRVLDLKFNLSRYVGGKRFRTVAANWTAPTFVSHIQCPTMNKSHG